MSSHPQDKSFWTNWSKVSQSVDTLVACLIDVYEHSCIWRQMPFAVVPDQVADADMTSDIRNSILALMANPPKASAEVSYGLSRQSPQEALEMLQGGAINAQEVAVHGLLQDLGLHSQEALAEMITPVVQAQMQRQLKNSLSIVQDWTPLHLMPTGQRGERFASMQQLAKHIEAQTTYHHRLEMTHPIQESSPTAIREVSTRVAGKGMTETWETVAGRVIWDPQTFPVVIPSRLLPEMLSGNYPLLRLVQVGCEQEAEMLLMTPKPWGVLHIQSPIIQLRGVLPLAAFQGLPDLASLLKIQGTLPKYNPSQRDLEHFIRVLQGPTGNTNSRETDRQNPPVEWWTWDDAWKNSGAMETTTVGTS